MNKLSLIFILLFFFFCLCFAQTTDTTYVKGDSLKVKNIQIFENWDYHPGDNSAWASPTFSSVGWQVTDCRVRLFSDSSQANNWTGIGWFRKTIVIDPSLKNKTVGMTLNHYGASEFYINGKLFNTFGKVSKDSETEEIYYSNSKPLIIHFNSDSTYLFAVRYSNHLPIDYPYLYKNFRGTFGFFATFKSFDEALNFYGVTQANESSQAAWFMGIFLSISVIYFLLFLFYSKQKEYLYYTIFTLSIALSFVISVLDNFATSSLLYFLGFTFITRSTMLALFLSILAFLYQIFYGQMLRLFRYLLAAGIGAYILQLFIVYDTPRRIIYFAVMFAATIEILRVVFLAIKRKKNNAWVIGAGVSVFVTGILIFFTLVLLSEVPINTDYIIYILLFSIPLSMSIYLARSSAQTNKNLETQLAYVKKLSVEAIEQEKKAAQLALDAQRARQENERKTKELEEARQLQLSMLPKELPKLPHLDIAVYMQTATEVGGDYYDFHVSIDGTLTVVIGDATGHGMKAGTMVTTAKSLFRGYGSNPDILFSFQEFSRCIREMNFGRLSMCLSMLKISDHTLKISTAAMPPAYIYRNASQKVEEYQFEAMPLGAMNKFSYQVKETKLNSGDTILLLSDGLPELENKKGEMYGYPKIREGFKGVAEKSPQEIINYLEKEGAGWVNNADPDDDVTFVVIKVK